MSCSSCHSGSVGLRDVLEHVQLTSLGQGNQSRLGNKRGVHGTIMINGCIAGRRTCEGSEQTFPRDLCFWQGFYGGEKYN